MSTVSPTPEVDVRRAADRMATQIGWLDSHHSFSFGGHHDPANTHFGLLLVSNDDVVRAGTGFETHPHRDMEIVTWVLDGQLVHQDSEGNSGVIYPGLAQRMTAGTGILHSEKNDAWRPTGAAESHEDVHFVQMWVLPDERGASPGYEQLDVNVELDRGGLVVVASGLPEHRDARAIRIGQRYAGLLAGRLAPGERVALPDAPFVHLFVAKGSAALEGAGELVAGDAVRLTAAGGPALTAGSDGAEVLVWQMAATLG
jgi:redox-sensitive bicupin YhaK (pirin superfamily)